VLDQRVAAAQGEPVSRSSSQSDGRQLAVHFTERHQAAAARAARSAGVAFLFGSPKSR